MDLSEAARLAKATAERLEQQRRETNDREAAETACPECAEKEKRVAELEAEIAGYDRTHGVSSVRENQPLRARCVKAERERDEARKATEQYAALALAARLLAADVREDDVPEDASGAEVAEVLRALFLRVVAVVAAIDAMDGSGAYALGDGGLEADKRSETEKP